MPELSIVICTYNRENYLREALNSLAKQSLEPGRFEIIVVDNNSHDNTAAVCAAFKKENPALNFRRVLEEKPGLSNARNCGIRESATDLIAFMDDDAIATLNYAEQVLRCAETHPEYRYFGGKVLPVYESGKEPEWMSKYLQKLVSKVDAGENAGPFTGNTYPVGCNMIFRKDVFNRYGRFNPQLEQRSDDKYIYHLMRENGVLPFYCPGIILYHSIENWRVEKSNIQRLARRNGIEERIRVGGLNRLGGWLKLFEYLFKYTISLFLLLGYVFKGKTVKGRYLLLVFRNAIAGFLHDPGKGE